MKDKSFWKCALWFIGFESIYWKFGDLFLNNVEEVVTTLMTSKVPVVIESSVYWRNGIYLVLFLIAVWCFKNFVKNIIILLRGETNGAS